MAAQVVSVALANDTDPHFRAWGSMIGAQLTLGGWVQTADTGQINWATVLKPAGASAVQGYEIWRSNDAAGSIVNYYLKIEYGSASGGAANPQIWVTFGWGSNGSGTLTGVLSTRTALGVNTTASATAVTNNLAAGNNWAAMNLGITSSLIFGFSVERCKDSSVADMNQILIVLWSASGSTYWTQVISSTVAYAQEATKGQLNPTAANQVIGTTVGLGLVFGWSPGLTNPSICNLQCGSGQLGSAQNTVTINHYGSSHTYIVNTRNAGAFYASASDHLMRFE